MDYFMENPQLEMDDDWGCKFESACLLTARISFNNLCAIKLSAQAPFRWDSKPKLLWWKTKRTSVSSLGRFVDLTFD